MLTGKYALIWNSLNSVYAFNKLICIESNGMYAAIESKSSEHSDKLRWSPVTSHRAFTAIYFQQPEKDSCDSLLVHLFPLALPFIPSANWKVGF